MATRQADLATAIVNSMKPLLPDPSNVPAGTQTYAEDTAKAILKPETLTVPPPGVTGPILAPMTVGTVQPSPADSVNGQLFVNTSNNKLYVFIGSWREVSLA